MSSLHQNSIIVVAFCSMTVLAGSAQDDKVVPVHQEPRHRLVFDSPGTRILDVQIPPGDTTLFHTHSDPILYVTMSTSQTRSQSIGAEWSGVAATTAAAPALTTPPRVAPSSPPGRLMSTTSYADKPQTHRVNNIGSSLFRLIGITNASPGDPSATPSADFSAKPELDNRWFRGYRWSLTPEPTEQHRHANPVAIVLINGAATAQAGDAKTPLQKPGDFVFIDANQPHVLIGAGPEAQIVEIEVRRPR
jgi:quercetin dioxygenase-like cupin family protein